MCTLAVALAPLTPHGLTTQAPSRELLAWRVAAGTLHTAVPSHPAGVAETAARHGITDRVAAAVAVVTALRTPGPRMAGTDPCVLGTFALLAVAGVLAVGTPAIVVACALAGQVIALTVWVTVALAFAVRTPELGRALGVTARSKVAMATAALVWPDTHLVFLAGKVPFAERCQAFLALLCPAAAARQPGRPGHSAHIAAPGPEFLAGAEAEEQTERRRDGDTVLHCHGSGSRILLGAARLSAGASATEASSAPRDNPDVAREYHPAGAQRARPSEAGKKGGKLQPQGSWLSRNSRSEPTNLPLKKLEVRGRGRGAPHFCPLRSGSGEIPDLLLDL